MSSIVRGIVIRNTSSDNRLLKGNKNDVIGRRSTKVQWKELKLRLTSTWKARRTSTYQPLIRAQTILTPTTPPTTKKVHFYLDLYLIFLFFDN